MADVRLIDAVAYCKELKEEMDYPGRSEEFMIAIDVAIADLADAPTIDATPVVHGRWEDFCGNKMCCCSVCKAEFDNTCNEIHGEWCYCPNCGAKMDLEVKNYG
jgi:hypothetical protein